MCHQAGGDRLYTQAQEPWSISRMLDPALQGSRIYAGVEFKTE